MRKFYLSVFMASAFLCTAANSNLLDRALVEVNNITYSQRQFQLYEALLPLANGEPGIKAATTESWRILIDEFICHMMIDHEALRIAASQPNDKVLASLEDQAKLLLNGEASAYLADLGADSSALNSTLTTILRVKRYVAGRNGVDERTPLKIDQLKDQKWFQSLRERTPYRLYKDADHYQALGALRYPVKAGSSKP